MTFSTKGEVGEAPVLLSSETPTLASEKISDTDWNLFILETEDSFEIHVSKIDADDLEFAALIERGCGVML